MVGVIALENLCLKKGIGQTGNVEQYIYLKTSSTSRRQHFELNLYYLIQCIISVEMCSVVDTDSFK